MVMVDTPRLTRMPGLELDKVANLAQPSSSFSIHQFFAITMCREGIILKTSCLKGDQEKLHTAIFVMISRDIRAFYTDNSFSMVFFTVRKTIAKGKENGSDRPTVGRNTLSLILSI
jgi:hypothetical protein